MKKIFLTFLFFVLPSISFGYCLQMTASSFGTTIYNGVYNYDSLHNAIPAYTNGDRFVYWQTSNNWLMSATLGADEGHFYYAPDTTPTDPTETTFLVSSGSSPAGSFVCDDLPPGPATSTATSTFPYTYHDWIFVNSIIIACLSFLVWRVVFSPFGKGHNYNI